MWSELGRDVRYTVRGLRRAPTFAATVIVTLSLGIGANSVIFSAIDAVLLRDVAVSEPDRLVEVYTSSGNTPYSQSSYPDYFDLRDSGTFASLAAYTAISPTMDANGQPEALSGQLVSGNYFEVLGVTLPVGRGFTPDDDRIGSPVRVAVISHALWHRTFNGDASVIGQAVRLNGHPYTLIGVAPPGFAGPRLGDAAEVWLPSALQPQVDPPAAAVRRARGHSAVFDLRRSRGLSWWAACRAVSAPIRSRHALRSWPSASRARIRKRTAVAGSSLHRSARVAASASRRDRCCGSLAARC